MSDWERYLAAFRANLRRESIDWRRTAVRRWVWLERFDWLMVAWVVFWSVQYLFTRPDNLALMLVLNLVFGAVLVFMIRYARQHRQHLLDEIAALEGANPEHEPTTP